MANEKKDRREDPELKLQEVEPSPRNEIHKLVVDLDQLVVDLKTLPLTAQLAVVRLVTPRVLARVAPSARASVIGAMRRTGPSLH